MEFGKEQKRLKDWHKGFTKQYWQKDFDITKNRRDGKSRLPFKVVAKIILTYLTIYFNELYFSKSKDMYSFLTGRFKVTKTSKFVEKPAIFWYMKPSPLWNTVKLRKMRGPTSRFCNLDQEFKAREDLDLLENPYALLIKYRKKKLLYRL